MDIYAKKSLGQNFLNDQNILKKISNTIYPNENDLVIEIGPGKGALTRYLLQKNCQYIGYEIDERMKPILENMTNQIIFDDFLNRDLKEDLTSFSYDKLYVVANIPYYITTPIIEHLIHSDLVFEKIVLLVQKEVANRFCAQPHTKDYGYFTVFLDYYFHVSKLFEVSRKCFNPIPNVDSAVVCFEKKDRMELNTKEYFSFLKTCFANKRKTLKNNLKNYSWDKIVPILKQNHLSESVRAEELSPSVLLELFYSI